MPPCKNVVWSEANETKEHARKAGPLGKGDKTAYLEEQKNWGKGRSDRPAILFEFKKPENAYPASDPPALSIFIDGIRKIVIDVINNRPLRTFPHLPITISSTVEGWLQEAWFRQDPAVRAEDLIQRMAYTAEHNVYENRNVINKLVRRREVFRNEGRCLSWTKGVWTKECDRYLIREMQETHDPANPNSTRHLKDLTPDDKAAFRDKTYMTGNYFSKSGNRELTGKRREEKDRAVADREAKRSAEVARKVSDLNTGHELGEDQAQIKTRGSEATDSQTLHDTASVQLREQARPVPMAPSASSMSHPNMLSVSGPETPRNLNREKVHDGLSGRGDDHNAASADLQTTEQPDASLMNTLTDGYPVHLEPPFLPIDQQHYVQPQSQRLSNHATPLDLVGHPQQFQQSHGQREQYTFGDDLSEVGRHSHPGPIRSAGPQPLYPRAPISSFGMGPPLHTPYMYNIGESRPYFYPTDPYMSQSNVFDEYQSPFFPGGYYPNFDLNSNIFMQDRLIRDVPAHLQSHPGQVSTAPFFPQQPQQPQQHQHVYGAIHGDVNGDIWTAGQSSAHDNESFAPVPYAHPFEPASSRRYEMMAGGNQQRAEDDDAQGHITVGTSRATSRKRGAAVEPDSDLAGPSRKFRKLD